jgi:hypothetical protein
VATNSGGCRPRAGCCCWRRRRVFVHLLL